MWCDEVVVVDFNDEFLWVTQSCEQKAWYLRALRDQGKALVIDAFTANIVLSISGFHQGQAGSGTQGHKRVEKIRYSQELRLRALKPIHNERIAALALPGESLFLPQIIKRHTLPSLALSILWVP